MLRRKLLKWGVGSLAVGAAGLSYKYSLNKKNNVLFVVVDDLNTWIGCMSHLRAGIPLVKTPNIDKLAREGMLFTNAHTPVPWCMPARNNTMLGLYPDHSHIYSDEIFRDVFPDTRTLPEHFRDCGYTTIGAGKIFHDTDPQAQVWDIYEQFLRPPSQRKQVPALNGLGSGNGDSDTLDWGKIAISEKDLTDTKIADWIIGALNQEHKKPFFMAAGFRFPHLPWYLPERFLNEYTVDQINLPWVKENDLDDVPLLGKKMALYNPFATEVSVENSDYAHVLKSNQWKFAVRAYMAAITCVDEQIGRVMAALDKSRYKENTIVMLWSDNGFHLGEKLHWRKFTLWDQATRIPLLMRVPKLTRPESQSNAAVSLVDLYPTLVDLCSLSPPAHKLSGKSLVPLLSNPGRDWGGGAYVTYGKGNNSVINERWRYIRYADSTEELYDHTKDPHEWENVANKPELAEIKKQLLLLLEANLRG